MTDIDVIEQQIADRSLDLLKILLKDKTTGFFIKWCTDNYISYGDGFRPEQDQYNPAARGKTIRGTIKTDEG